MSHASPAFAFPVPAEPLVLAAARTLASRLGAGEIISRPDLTTILSEHFGGSDAAGRWSLRDAHAALELGQVLHLQQSPALTCALEPELADEAFSRLEALVPSQNNRSDEQIELQQLFLNISPPTY